MRKTERRLAFAVLPLVALAVALGAYNLRGPFGTSPITVVVPLPAHSGLYVPALPDFVFVRPGFTSEGNEVLTHERLHYYHPSWSECQVAREATALTGMTDGYIMNGTC